MSNDPLDPHDQIAKQALARLAGWIAQQRKVRGISRSEICERANLDPTTLEALENADPEIPLGSYLEVASLLDLRFFDVDSQQIKHLLHLQAKILQKPPTNHVRDDF